MEQERFQTQIDMSDLQQQAEDEPPRPSKWAARIFQRPAVYTVAASLVSISGLLFGMDTGTIGPVTQMPHFISKFGPFSSTVQGLIVSSVLISASITSFFAGHLADHIGRTRTISVGAFIFGIGTCLEAGSVHLAMFFIGRLITGVGEGFFLSQTTVYVTEISPPSKRGLLASLVQFTITLGLCVGFFASYGTVRIESSASWRIPFIIQAVVAFSLAVICVFCLPRSPRWLMAKGRVEEAIAEWEKLNAWSDIKRSDDWSPPPASSAAAVAVDADAATFGTDMTRVASRKDMLMAFRSGYRIRTALGVFLMASCQLTGIDGVLYYAPVIFAQAGLNSTTGSFLASGVSALVIFAVTIPSVLLADKWGRRTSAIVGSIGCCAAMILIGAMYASNSVHGDSGAGRWVVIVCIYVFAIFYSATYAIGFRVYASEIHPDKTRAAATSLGQSVNWVVNWIIAFTTPIFLSDSSSGAYFMFGSFCFLTLIVVVIYMPETSGRTFQQIDLAFRQRKKWL